MNRWNFCSSAFCRHSYPNIRSSHCSLTTFGTERDETWSSATSCQTPETRNGKEPFGVFVPEKQDKLLYHPHGQGEGDSKQSDWKCPRYWEWPTAYSTEMDFCSLPSDTDIQPKGVCVKLEIPVVKKKTFPASEQFLVTPPSVIFRQDPTSGKWEEFAWIRVQNKGNVSRRLNLVIPSNPTFTVDWAATLKEKTVVPPGLFIHVRIQFTPKSDDPITDELVIRVEGDGGIVVPISASPQDPPLLEFQDWNCECCLVGQKLVHTFRITNRGGVGRFWLLGEAEFMNEISGFPSPVPTVEPRLIISVEEKGPVELEDEQEKLPEADRKDENAGESVEEDFQQIPTPPNTAVLPGGLENQHSTEGIDPLVERPDEGPIGEDENEDGNPSRPPNTPHSEPSGFRPGQLRVPPFRLAPAAFSLKGGQTIKIRVDFTPSAPKFYHERVALLCDNGEVRWCSLKGLGIEPKTQRIITIHGENWDSDGPNTTLDLGDLSPEEPLSHKLKIRNSSTIPVYFFWVLEEETKCPLSSSEVYAAKAQCLEKGSNLVELEGEDGEREEPGEDFPPTPRIPLTITPNQGVLMGCREVECTLDLVCPTPMGSYASRVSLHIQQFSPESLRAMALMSRRDLQAEVKRQIGGQGKRKADPFSARAYMDLPVFRIPPIPEEPTNELEIWLRCVPIQCFFEPSLLKYSGTAFTHTKRKLKFFNSTKHPVMLRLENFESEFVNIAISPKSLRVPPQTELCFKVVLHFQQAGELERDVIGSLELPFKMVKVYLPARITSEVPPPCPAEVVHEPQENEPPITVTVSQEALTEKKVEGEGGATGPNE